MTCWSIYEEMIKEYNKNLKNYIKNHAGEYIALKGTFAPFGESFFETKHDLAKYLNNYAGVGRTIFTEQIPKKMPTSIEKQRKKEFLKYLKMKHI